MKKKLNIPLSLLWGIFILVLTLLPGTFIPVAPDFMSLFQPDKLVHIFLFGVLTLFIFVDLSRRNNKPSHKNRVLTGILISAALGGIIELVQAGMNMGRQGSVYDFIADIAGALMGWAVIHFFLARKYS
ncbi:MAG: VanZ family protein [Syntrophothermus sp.]